MELMNSGLLSYMTQFNVCILLYSTRWQYWWKWHNSIQGVNDKFDVITEVLSMEAMKATTDEGCMKECQW